MPMQMSQTTGSMAIVVERVEEEEEREQEKAERRVFPRRFYRSFKSVSEIESPPDCCESTLESVRRFSR